MADKKIRLRNPGRYKNPQAAREGLNMPHMNHEQLPMFMTAGEIMSTHQPSEWDRSPKWGRGGVSTGIESHAETMTRKLAESKEIDEVDKPSLHSSIAAEGVHQPVHLAAQFGMLKKPQIVEGHHRVISSLDTDPNRYIPVIHHNTPDDAGLYILDNE